MKPRVNELKVNGTPFEPIEAHSPIMASAYIPCLYVIVRSSGAGPRCALGRQLFHLIAMN